MPSLDQVLASSTSAEHPGTRQVLEGELVVRDGERFVRIDDSAALWGPVVGGDTLDSGEWVVVAITQNSTPVVIYPQA